MCFVSVISGLNVLCTVSCYCSLFLEGGNLLDGLQLSQHSGYGSYIQTV